MNKHKTIATGLVTVGILGLAAASPFQGGNTLINFQPNTTALAAEVNANFQANRNVANAAQTSADSAATAAANAQNSADGAVVAANNAQGTADAAAMAANNALGAANVAASDAAAAQTTASNAQTAAGAAQATADSAATAAAAAQSTADSAQTSANSAVSTATTAQTTADTALLAVQGFDKITVDPFGHVGLGTTMPNTNFGLHVQDLGLGNDWVGSIAAGSSTGFHAVLGEHKGVATVGGHGPTVNSWEDLDINPGGGDVRVGDTSSLMQVIGESELGSRAAVNDTIDSNARFTVTSGDPAFGTMSLMAGEFGPGADLLFDGGTDGIVGIRNSAPNGRTEFLGQVGPILSLNTNGNVGVGTNFPSQLFSVNGSAGKPGGGSWSNFSDRRLKKNIEDLDGALDTLLELRGVSFEYKDPEAINELAGERIGFVAQEVESVLPDWVEDAGEYKMLTIRGFEALAVEALRELRGEVASKDAEIDELRAEVERLRGVTERVEALESALHEVLATR